MQKVFTSHRDTKFAEFGIFLLKNSLLQPLNASAVKDPRYCGRAGAERLPCPSPWSDLNDNVVAI